MKGELEQIILNKIQIPFYCGEYEINYELEPVEKKKLFNLYPSPQNV